MSEATAGSIQTVADIGTKPSDVVRRWLLEIQLSEKGEQSWRKEASKVYDRYRGEKRRKNSFNILWSNTEVLRPAIYNSAPQPDIRRRFRDADPIGKAVSQTLERATEFSISSYDFDAAIKLDVLDMLLAGRGLSRIRYIPSLKQVGIDNAPGDLEHDEQHEDKSHETQQGEQTEELEWEQVTCEHVNWQDFRRGPGRTWGELTWVAFRHRLTREQMIERFGDEIGSEAKLDEVQDQEIRKMRDDDPVKSIFQTGEVWEVWDKESRKVLFISNGYGKSPLKEADDPLELEQFFPIPKPCYCIEDSDTLVPVILFEQYAEQANELDNVSYRINKLVDALKLRGVYDATIREMSEVMRGNDNDLIPAANVSTFIERGGIEKMVWWMPIDQVAKVLVGLYQQREQCINVIYQLTGISDIMRSTSDPNETATAQRLKTTFGTLRLQRLQKEIQRYCRDLIRLMAEVIAKKFQPETLQQMTMLPFMTQQQEMQAQAQYQQQAQQAMMQGQQPPPPPQLPIAWTKVIEALHDNATRQYHIDIETDSTISDQLMSDMAGMKEAITSVVEVINGFGPAVVQGAMPIDAVKEIIGAVVRRARMGNSIEDAIDKMKAPTPPPDPEKAKAQTAMQTQQMKMQADAQALQQKMQADMQSQKMEMQMEMAKTQMKVESEAKIEAMKQQLQAQETQAQNQIEAQRAQYESQLQAQLDHQKMQYTAQIEQIKNDTDWAKAQLDRQTRLEIAEISAKTTLNAAQISAAKTAETAQE